MKDLSRRAFLAAAGAAAASLPAAAIAQDTDPLPIDGSGLPAGPEYSFVQPQRARLNLWGRITEWGTPIRVQPGLGNEVSTFIGQNQVIPLLEEIRAEGTNPRNDLWYRVPQGYIYTDRVQPMRPYRMPQIITDITTTIAGEPGFWAEIIVPYTAVRLEPSGAPYRIEDPEDETNIISVVGFYGSVHRVVAAEPDGAGFMWYKLFNDKPDETPFYYILARHMRMIPPSAFEPINPGADKMMEVNLTEQTITCYESGVPVFSTLTSSGGDGFATPLGEHAVVYKQPSRYMFSDPEQEAFSDPNFFDLPGVPFNIFFTTLGHAIHGTYWHGDYGRPRSHGCLNVLPETARWLYRWVEPVAPYDMDAAGSSADPGTPIIVV